MAIVEFLLGVEATKLVLMSIVVSNFDMLSKLVQWINLLFCPLPTLWTICHVMHIERHVAKAGDQSQNCWATASRILGRNMFDVYVYRIGCCWRKWNNETQKHSTLCSFATNTMGAILLDVVLANNVKTGCTPRPFPLQWLPSTSASKKKKGVWGT